MKDTHVRGLVITSDIVLFQCLNNQPDIFVFSHLRVTSTIAGLIIYSQNEPFGRKL